MLHIRTDQIAVLQRAGHADAITHHIRRFFPDICEGLTGPQMEARIQAALERSCTYGITSIRDQYRYLNVCAVLGWTFDEDPTHGWARAMLDDRQDVPSASQRLNRVWGQVIRDQHRAELRAECLENFDASNEKSTQLS